MPRSLGDSSAVVCSQGALVDLRKASAIKTLIGTLVDPFVGAVPSAMPAISGLFPAAGDPSWWDTVIGWFRDPTGLLISMGPWVLLGVVIIVFVESGVLFPVLPGDSLIFAAGLLHLQLGLNIWVLIGSILIAAFAGAQVGYWIGRKWGRRLFKDDARILKTEYLVQAENFFDRYGGRSLVIGRFIPFVRTYVPLAAGIARFPYGKFLIFNTLGALIWGGGVTWAGSALGGVQFVHDNLEVIILLIIVVSVMPMVVEYILARRRSKREQAAAATSPFDPDPIDADGAGSHIEAHHDEPVHDVERGRTQDPSDQ